MRTQFDSRVRVVALDNLRAMCAKASGWAHQYEVSKVSRSRVHVTYSNPDEYGNPRPVTAVFPCYPSIHDYDDTDNPRIVLDALRVIGDDDHGTAYQSIDAAVIQAPSVWRANAASPFYTHREMIGAKIADASTAAPCRSCVLCDAKGGSHV